MMSAQLQHQATSRTVISPSSSRAEHLELLPLEHVAPWKKRRSTLSPRPGLQPSHASSEVLAS